MAVTHIIRNPEILGGKPIISGTRISVEFILELLASGMTIPEIASEYDLLPEAVQAAVTFAAHGLKGEERINLERV